MNEEYIKTKVLITVKTYPHPSQSYRELVCTAGITSDGEWIRLYPIDYRYRPVSQQFHKYQWVEVGLLPRGSGNDNRRESRKPDLESIRILGPRLSAANSWRGRREIIDKLPRHTLKQLQALYESDRISLGIVRPTKILDMKIELDERDWKPEWQQLFSQFRLFGPSQKPLRRIPYKFTYIFECEDSDKPHNAMIEDWELGTLWLNEAERFGDEDKAAEQVKRKFFDEMCNVKKDTQFFMGTIFPWNTWVVIGVYWPPKEYQTSFLC